MTSLITFVTPTAIHIATDGAAYLNDGRVVHESQKIVILAHLPAVIGIRGPFMLIPSIVANVSANFTEFDGFAAAAPDLFRAIHEQYRQATKAVGIADRTPSVSEFVVAGWSADLERPVAFGLHSHNGTGVPPWEPFAIEHALVSPSDPSLMSEIGPIYVEDIAEEPEDLALRYMEMQRERSYPLEDGSTAPVVGAFCQFTTLTRDGISTRIVKRWT